MLRKLRHLPLLCEAAVALVRARVRVSRGVITSAPRLNDPASTMANRVAWAINRAAPLVPRATCLVRAIAAHQLLARYGHAATVHIGVAKSDLAGFEAHAWVECNGAVVIGRSETTYTRLLNWSAAR